MNSDDESEGLKQYYGKYRGTVINNIDPEQRGRIMAMVPDVLGLTPSSWAMPCFPSAGKMEGMFVIPQIGAGVWIEFEQGDPDYPIWVGCWWGSRAEVPLTAQTIPPGMSLVIFETALKNGFVLSDTPIPSIPPLPIGLPSGGIILRSGTSYIRIDSTGISIYGPKVSINGNSVVDINSTALTVTGPGAPV